MLPTIARCNIHWTPMMMPYMTASVAVTCLALWPALYVAENMAK